jgi:hypothetical protein
MKQLESLDEIIAALGGVPKMARITSRKTQAIWNWRGRQYIPPRAFDDIERALRRRGFTVARSAFAFDSTLRKRNAA